MIKRIYRDTFDVAMINHNNDLVPLVVEDKPDNLDKFEALFSAIYASDSTGFPRGDLQMFMSSEAAPEIREFIAKNLMQPTSKVPTDSKLSDDDIVSLSRQHDESRQEYSGRMSKWLREYVDNLKKD